MSIAVLLIGSYILGSIPFGVIVVKAWCGVDVRQYGSGNIGATNVLRTAGKAAAAIVFILDVLKGYFPVFTAGQLFQGNPNMPYVAIAAGFLALIGHTASVFLKFQGGKGVATGLGIFIGLNPVIAFTAFGIWILMTLITRIVSLSSIAATASIPVQMLLMRQPLPYSLFGVLAAAYVIIKHRANIVRLLQGKEPKWGQKVKVTEDKDAKGN